MSTDPISRRDFALGAAAATAAGGLAFEAPEAWAAAGGTRPNILFITMDELNPMAWGGAGNPHISTPALDRLAARGTTFTRTYCQGPLCQPARASLVTGQYVKETGQSWNGFDMKPEWPTMMKAMQAAGYTTAVVGKTHFGGRPGDLKKNDAGLLDMASGAPWIRKFGLDYALEEYDHTIHKNPRITTPYLDWLRGKGLVDQYRAEIRTAATSTKQYPYWEGAVSTMADDDQLSAFIADRSIDWLDSHPTDKPFFLWTSFVAPHPPITAAANWYDRYKDADIPVGTRALPDMPDNAWGKYLRTWATQTMSIDMTDDGALQMARHYYAVVSEADARIGAILKALADKGLDKNTWVIFSADHGEMLGHHNLVYKNVFYAGSVRVPNIVVPPGGMKARKVDTPVEAIDLTATMLELAGASLPTARGHSLTPWLRGGGKAKAAVFSELAGHNNKGNYLVMVATDRYRYTYDKLNDLPCELFDLRDDPDEMHNLVADPRHAALRQDLHKDFIQPFIQT